MNWEANKLMEKTVKKMEGNWKGLENSSILSKVPSHFILSPCSFNPNSNSFHKILPPFLLIPIPSNNSFPFTQQFHLVHSYSTFLNSFRLFFQFLPRFLPITLQVTSYSCKFLPRLPRVPCLSGSIMERTSITEETGDEILRNEV